MERSQGSRPFFFLERVLYRPSPRKAKRMLVDLTSSCGTEPSCLSWPGCSPRDRLRPPFLSLRPPCKPSSLDGICPSCRGLVLASPPRGRFQKAFSSEECFPSGVFFPRIFFSMASLSSRTGADSPPQYFFARAVRFAHLSGSW